jgi:hypothetical protein
MSDRRAYMRGYMSEYRRKKRAEALRKQEENRSFWDCFRRVIRQEVRAALAEHAAAGDGVDDPAKAGR